MTAYLAIGPAPADEDCAQVGTPDYQPKALVECKRYIELLRKLFGKEPDGAQLVIKKNLHDFGWYHEVNVRFDDQIPEAIEYAYKVDGEAPTTW